jgi:hypothetical protein
VVVLVEAAVDITETGFNLTGIPEWSMLLEEQTSIQLLLPSLHMSAAAQGKSQ